MTDEASPVILQAMTSALGADAAAIRSLPDYDFSMARDRDRLTWTGGANYLVAIAPRTEEGPATAFRADGGRELIHTQADIGDRVVFLIQPAEYKHKRLNPQPNRAGNTIQDSGDGVYGGSVTLVSGRDTIIMDLAEFSTLQQQEQCPNPEDCPQGGGGGGGQSQGSEGTTYVEDVYTFGLCDNAPLCDSNEIEWTAHWTLGSSVFTGWVRITGIPVTGSLHAHAAMIAKKPNQYIPVELFGIKETDTINDDTFCPTGQLMYENSQHMYTSIHAVLPGCVPSTNWSMRADYKWQ